MLKFFIPFRCVVCSNGDIQIFHKWGPQCSGSEHTAPRGIRTNSNLSSVDLANWWAVIAGPDIANWLRLPDETGVGQDTFGSTLAGGSLVWSVVLHLRPPGRSNHSVTLSDCLANSPWRKRSESASPPPRAPPHARLAPACPTCLLLETGQRRSAIIENHYATYIVYVGKFIDYGNIGNPTNSLDCWRES